MIFISYPDFWHKRNIDNFDPYNVLLAIANFVWFCDPGSHLSSCSPGLSWQFSIVYSKTARSPLNLFIYFLFIWELYLNPHDH